VWTYVFKQFSCFCQFLMDNFCYSIMSLYILGRCQLLTCCSNVLDHLRFFSTSSAQLIGVWLLQNIFLVVFVSMTWSCIAVKKPSVSANRSSLVSRLFNASMSTYYWLRPYRCRLCKAFWDHCLLTLLLYSSSVASSFSFAQNKSSGVYLSSAFTTAA